MGLSGKSLASQGALCYYERLSVFAPYLCRLCICYLLVSDALESSIEDLGG